MAFEKNTSAGFLANLMARMFAARLSKSVQGLGLAPAQFMVLLELWDGDGITQKDLVDRLEVEQATMANTLRRMLRDELIAMRPNPDDGRAKLIFLTNKARDLQEEATKAANEVNQAALARLSHEESAQLIALMTKVIAGLRRA